MVHDEHEQQFPNVTPGIVPGGGRKRSAPRSERDPGLGASIPSALASFGLGMTSSVAHLSRDQLIATLHDEAWTMRIAAIHQLEQLKEQVPVSELLTVLHDPHQDVRAAVIRALGQAGERTPIADLIATLLDPSWRVRAATIHVLGKQHGLVPIEHFVAALHDDEEAVRIAVLAALGKCGDTAPVEAIVSALHDPSWMVREAAALALNSSGVRAPTNALLEALKDEDSTVRAALQQALSQAHAEYSYRGDISPHLSKQTTGENSVLAPVSSTFSIETTHPFTTNKLEPQISIYPSGGAKTEQGSALHRQASRLLHAIKAWICNPGTTQARPTWKKTVFRSGLAAAVLFVLFATALLKPQVMVSPASKPATTTIFTKTKNLDTAGMTHMTWSSSGSPSIAYMDENGLVHVWDTSTGHYVSSYGPFPTGLAINWLPTGLSIASVRPDGAVQLTSEGTAEQTLMPALGLIDAKPLASWSPDGSHFAIALHDGGNSTIQICDTTITSHCAISFAQMVGPVTAIAWSVDGKEIAAASENDATTTLTMLDADSGKPTRPSVTLTNLQLGALAWSPDNQHLAYLLSDGSVHILGDNASTHLTLDSAASTNAHTVAWQGALAWSPDGRLLATTMAGGMIQIWDTSTNALLTTYQEYSTLIGTRPVSPQISALMWSHDGKRLASIDINGKVLVWNTNEHQNSPQPDCTNACDIDGTQSRTRNRLVIKDQPAISPISGGKMGEIAAATTKP